MIYFERASLSRKLTMISVLSTGSALMLVCMAFAASSVASRIADERRQLAALSNVLGHNSVAALRRGDRRQAEQALAALDGSGDIVQAVLFDNAGGVLARYAPSGRDDGSSIPPPDALTPSRLAALNTAELQSERGGALWLPVLRVYRVVRQRDDAGLLGVVMIEGEPGRVWSGLPRKLAASGAAALLSLLVALLMAARFRASIARPLAELTAAARQVSRSEGYSHRIAHRRSDELGVLIDSFNDMLAQVEERDASLADYREQLERQVGVRTEQLEKAKNSAEAASRAKSAFLATMSHEIRTPMNGVLGMTELLLSTRLTEQQRHYTGMVKRSGEHLLVIINDILDFSKIEAGKLTVEYIHFNLRELLDDIENVFAPQAQAKGLALELAIDDRVPIAICGDPNRLRQIIVNLMGNAIKFTDSGKITVRVAITREDGQGVGLRFEVHDTGIGVSREARARIFDSFSQADGSTTRKHGGTGLGLAISRQLVELMGGTIGVEHALTQGAMFWFAVHFDKRRVDGDDPSFLNHTTPGLRALIVDEHPTSRAALERQLTGWQLACTGAGATDALPLLRQAAADGRPYDVVLLDMALPRTSGLALAAAISADPALSAAPDRPGTLGAPPRLLLLSTERDAADSVQRRAAGVAYQLIKPPRACDLYDGIFSPLRSADGARGAATAWPAQAVAATLAAPSSTLSNPLSKPLSKPIPPRPGHAPIQPLSQPKGSARPRKRRQVLLAEDNPVNVEVASAMLESLGLDVSRAGNGEEALRSVRAQHFDLVLMDCQMPVMDGFAATAEIRRHESGRGRARVLPIIAITANALQGDRESCLAAGMDDYLSKPFTQQALRQTISRWIKLPRPAAPAGPDEDAARLGDEAAPLLADTTEAAAGDTVDDTADETATAQADSAPPQAAARPQQQQPQQQPQQPLRPQALDNIRALSPANGDALLARVLQAYLQDTPAHLQTIRAAIAGQQPETLRKAAHSLKSSSANIGADLLAQHSKALEQLGRNNTCVGAAAILAEMEAGFQAVRHALGAITEKET